MKEKEVIVFQIGAREHYALPRAFLLQNKKVTLVTDFWYDERSLLSKLFLIAGGHALMQRTHQEVGGKMKVVSFNLGLLVFELKARLMKLNGWELIHRRNKWFGEKAASWLRKELKKNAADICVFSYSYAAREVFEVAKEFGCSTILGQIDGAEAEVSVVKAEIAKWPEYRESFSDIPTQYWKSWRAEIAIADSVVVNSDWSRKLALINNVPLEKLRIIPLAFSGMQNNVLHGEVPMSLIHERHQPLKVLYLGTLTLRKGLARVFELAKLIDQSKLKIEITIAGIGNIYIPEHVKRLKCLNFIGKVERAETDKVYRQHHVFLFPTVSDGFGLTQLEALSNGCFLIVSDFCGKVIPDSGELGIVLKGNTAAEMFEVFKKLIEHGVPKHSKETAAQILERHSLLRIGAAY